MLIPSSALVRCMVLWLLSAVAVAIWPVFTVHWLGVSTVFVVIVLSDALLAARRVHVELRRSLPGSAPLGVWVDVRVRLENLDRMLLSCEVFDHYPAGCTVEGMPRRLRAAPRGWVELTYRLRPE